MGRVSRSGPALSLCLLWFTRRECRRGHAGWSLAEWWGFLACSCKEKGLPGNCTLIALLLHTNCTKIRACPLWACPLICRALFRKLKTCHFPAALLRWFRLPAIAVQTSRRCLGSSAPPAISLPGCFRYPALHLQRYLLPPVIAG